MSKVTKKKVVQEAEAPKATTTPAASKAWMMANVVDGMQKMAPADLLPFFEKWQAMIGHEADSIPNGAAAKNLASVNSTNAVVKEELAEILDGETLSEETKEKASVLFEAAVGTRVAMMRAELEDEAEKLLNEEIDKINETLVEHIDKYLTYVAEQWVKENKQAVKYSIKTELAESFIRGMHSLFQEHHVSIPENQIDAVEALAEEVQNLRSQLDAQINENIQAQEQLKSFQKEDVIKAETDGLAMTQVERIKKLAEGVDFSDVDTFRKKVRLLKESQVPSGKKPVSKTEEEKIESKDEVEVTEGVADPMRSMAGLAKFISASVKK